jgi:DnaJ-domain-containing protein 1
MTTTGRRGRLFRRADEEQEDDDAADLSEDEHAWWAAREEVAGVPRGTPAGEASIPDGPTADTASGFSDYWSADSLFDEPQAEPPPTDEPTGVDVPGAMDLDSAHLVLQVGIGVSWEEITKAHRKLAMQYHPDRLVDWSPEAQDLGRARMAEINAAHATLRGLHFH